MAAEMKTTTNHVVSLGIPLTMGAMLVVLMLAIAMPMIGSPGPHHFSDSAHPSSVLMSQQDDTHSVLVPLSESPVFADRCVYCGKLFGTTDEAHQHFSMCIACGENKENGWPEKKECADGKQESELIP